MLENKYVVMYPMLDPNTFHLFLDQTRRPMMEMSITEKETGEQIMYEGKPLMMHPVLDAAMQPILDED
jgi:hypothetical protein